MSERLSRSLTFIGLLGFGFNIMIGSGIFFLPGEAMAIMGPASVLGVLAPPSWSQPCSCSALRS